MKYLKTNLTLLLKTLASDPYFDGTAKGSFNLGNVAEFYTFEPGTSLAGNLPLAARILVQTAKDNGGYDNVSVILARASVHAASPSGWLARAAQWLLRRRTH